MFSKSEFVKIKKMLIIYLSNWQQVQARLAVAASVLLVSRDEVRTSLGLLIRHCVIASR